MLIDALVKLPGPTYTHPISLPSSSSISHLNPYLPLPLLSSQSTTQVPTLITDATFLSSLPAPDRGLILVIGVTSLDLPYGHKGFIIVSRNSQEAYDHSLLGLRLARDKTVYHFISSQALGDVQEVESADLKDWLENSISTTPNGHINGDSSPNNQTSNAAHQNGIVDTDALLEAYEQAALATLKITRRPQRPFPIPATSTSKIVLNFLPYTLSSTDDTVILDIALASPISSDRLKRAVGQASAVVVVESSNGRYGTFWASIVDSLDGHTTSIRSILVGSEVSSSAISEAITSNSPITRLGSPFTPPSIPTSSITIPSPETTYTNLLTSSPHPLEILNDPSQLAANETTSPLYAFGKAVALRQERDRLVTLAKQILKSSSTRPTVHAAVAEWLLVRDESNALPAGQNVVETIRTPVNEEEEELLTLGDKGHWEKKSLWIVISNAWSKDLASSGLHHTLASGLDINLLVYETSPSPFSPGAPKSQGERKKDLALYALNMGDVYVASVAVYADYAGVINAMREAETYSGPGLVLAYLPWGEKEDGSFIPSLSTSSTTSTETSSQSSMTQNGTASTGQNGEIATVGETLGPLERLRETKRAVSGGWWPLFRWNPSLPDSKRFTLDSSHIKNVLAEFLDRQSHLSQLTRTQPDLEASVPLSVGEELTSKRKQKARAAYEALVNSLDGPGLLVLYASDGGNAEKVAKRLVGRAKMRGVAASLKVLDELAEDPINLLKEEENVLVITSTAGQGEFPQNGREFWKVVSKLSPTNSVTKSSDSNGDDVEGTGNQNKTKLTVFGMGDSHYWPRPEDAGYYNKPAKDLYPRLLNLGFTSLTDLGLGDDSDPDGYLTGYKPFEASLWRALGVDAVEVAEEKEETVANEHMKIASDYLRGTIMEGLEDTTTGAMGVSDGQLLKFHGTYQQDDRDIRESLKAQGLEPAYAFMIRVRLPGGVCTPEQWLAMDRIADERGNGTFKLTTRQTFQFHGIVKRHLREAMRDINRSLLDTIAACGDVNRNVQCTVNPSISSLHAEVYEFSKRLSEHLLPKTSAYHEIWLGKKQIAGEAVQDFEPMYGPTYLPRKFKMAVAIPPDNAVDVYTNDVGFIAIVESGKIVGYNVLTGGGMGVTHSNKKTYPRLGDLLGFVLPEDGHRIAEAILLVQRDNGNRQDRKNARLKYTIDRMTLPIFKTEVEKRFGKPLLPSRPFEFDSNLDHYGWTKGQDGKSHFTIFIENGRIENNQHDSFKTGLKDIAKIHKGQFRLTPNQHVILSDVPPEELENIKKVLKKWGLDNLNQSKLRLSSSACVAFPTCGLAMAESERYLPLLVDKVEKICEEAGVGRDSIVMRMTGCPNGCARPWNAEIAMVGKAPGSYMMLLGGSPTGNRLNKPFKSSVTEPEILSTLKPLIKRWSLERNDGEHFGDWVIRAGIIKATTHGTNFWNDSAEA
ncbi:sulfite reductase (NADPH) hemoprotein, beta-component [Tremella mesenterica]|uniref:assimilatory sulfite reductase (NADPH) n=1 Tax=Tremella mesenterica TaxID=5217 RepID=A0A4Q1BJN1_TREME|nr:sulfite reductase (NADPH) hemoprotein, beta-component [Tremella mesenterica]